MMQEQSGLQLAQANLLVVT